MNCTQAQYNDPSHPCFFEDSGKTGDWVSFDQTKNSNMEELPKIAAGTGLTGTKSPTQTDLTKTGIALNAGVGLTGTYKPPSLGDKLQTVQVTTQAQDQHIRMYSSDKNYAAAQDQIGLAIEQNNGVVTDEMRKANDSVLANFWKLNSSDAYSDEQKESIGQKLLTSLGFSADSGAGAGKQTFWQKNGKTIVIIAGILLAGYVVYWFLAPEKIKPLPEKDVLLDLRKK